MKYRYVYDDKLNKHVRVFSETPDTHYVIYVTCEGERVIYK